MANNNAGTTKSLLKSLFSPNAAENKQQFGVNLTTNSKAFSGELSNVSDKFVRTNKKYRDEIAKYKKIAELNKQLTAAYKTNLNVMIDVSKLLTDYSAFFHVLKEEVIKTEGQIGTLQASEVQHIEDLTKEKLGQVSNSFMDQSEKVKQLLSKYGQEEQIKSINSAQESMNNVMASSGNTWKAITAPNTAAKGGRSKAYKKKTLK